MKMVYIAGPYGDKGGYLAIDKHIAVAREAAAWCASQGLGYYCPHLNAAHFEVIVPQVPIDQWYEMDLMFIEMCDHMLVLPGWENSSGTKAEMEAWKQVKSVHDIFFWGDDHNDIVFGAA